MTSDPSPATREGTDPRTSQRWAGDAHSTVHEEGMQIDRNVVVPTRSGHALRVDVYRNHDDAVTDRVVPVIVAWSPYGKHGELDWRGWPGHDVDVDALSRFTSFETPDPVQWTARGYAVVVADALGTWGSEGDVSFLGPPEARACYDLVEWAGEQAWSNGRVGLAGVSWYAQIQWAVAAMRPPHLAAINPWEGFSNLYHEVARHGGIPETQFLRLLQPLISFSSGQVEDLPANADLHPFFDDYWSSKVADFSQIEVPAYVVASWTDHGLHTRGTLEAFRRIGSRHKWLEVHGQKKWSYYYLPDSVSRQMAFFDHFLKREDAGLAAWPPVRLEVRAGAGVGVVREEAEWPLARTVYREFHLDAGSHRLTPDVVDAAARTEYDAATGQATFDLRFDEDTEITGHVALRLWVEAVGSDDMDLFIGLQKVDAAGTRVPFPFFATFDDGDVALGWLRVSRRELDTETSTPEQPRYTQTRELPVRPGEITPVDIEVLPSSTLFLRGETLRLVIQGRDLHTYPEPAFAQRHQSEVNRGRHVLHTGGEHVSRLLLPFISVHRGASEDGAAAED